MPTTTANFAKEYDRSALSMNECSNFITYCVGIDDSGSMGTVMSNGKTRFQNAVDELEASLVQMQKNEALAENCHLLLYVFGGREVRCIVDSVALYDLDVAEMCRKLRAMPCTGLTPMGQCINVALDRTAQIKQAVAQHGICYSQPILALLSDGEPTDSMDEAKTRIFELMNQRQQKLLLLPVGIGEPGTKFPVFDELLSKDKTETPVLTCAEDLRAYFRLLNKTVAVVNAGRYVTPAEQFGQIRTIAANAANASQNGGGR